MFAASLSGLEVVFAPYAAHGSGGDGQPFYGFDLFGAKAFVFFLQSDYGLFYSRAGGAGGVFGASGAVGQALVAMLLKTFLPAAH